MDLKKFTVFSGFIILLMIITVIACAEESVAPPADSVAVLSGEETVSKNGNDTQWAWGEVVKLDVQAGTVTLKYLDYETDQEKEIVLSVDEKTSFENTKSLEEIKIKDTLSIDYIAGADGKNAAKNINLEKPDVSTSAPVQSVEDVKPVETAAQPAVDTAVLIANPTETPAPVAAPVPGAVQPVVQPEAVGTSIEPVSEASTQPAPEPAPVVQEGQVQQ